MALRSAYAWTLLAQIHLLTILGAVIVGVTIYHDVVFSMFSMG
jgi:hypothetical protein